MSAFALTLIPLVLLSLTGCFGGRKPIYVESGELPPIEVPEGLTEPPVRSAFEIPGYMLPELAASGNVSLPPEVLPSAEAEKSRSRIRFGPTGLYLEVDDEPASVWRRLSFALNRGGMQILDVQEDKRRFKIDFQHPPIVGEQGFLSRTLLFWRSGEVADFSGSYLLEVQPESAERTRVAILHSSGDVVLMEQAEYVLARLRERLG